MIKGSYCPECGSDDLSCYSLAPDGEIVDVRCDRCDAEARINQLQSQLKIQTEMVENLQSKMEGIKEYARTLVTPPERSTIYLIAIEALAKDDELKKELE